jgi:nucleoside-diphosphate-sugar epimerase
MSKVVVTGASGFVGRYLCERLENKIPIVRDSKQYTGDSVEVKDLNSDVPWDEILPLGTDCIIHLAGVAHNNVKDFNLFKSVNFEGTLHLAQQAVKFGVKRFVYVSSIGVNGQFTFQRKFSPFDIPEPFNHYTISKYNAEEGLRALAKSTGLEVVIIRPTLVYGPNAPGNFGLLTKLVNKLSLLPFGLTDNKRDFIAVQNLTDLLITCANHPDAAGHTFLASDGETVSIKDFTNAISKGLDKKLIQLPVPVSLMYLAARLVGKHAIAEQVLGNLQVDSSNAQEVLGWVPPYTMEQAMASLSENKK